MDNSPYTVHGSETPWSCPYFSVQKDDVELPNGHRFDYHYVQNKNCTVIVPVTTDGNIVLIKQYRHPVSHWTMEVPAGGMEEGMSPEETAHKELKEEIGGTAEHMEFISIFHPSNGSFSEKVYVYLATGVTLGERHTEETEFIEMHTMPAKEAMALVRRGGVECGMSALSLLLCEDRLKKWL